jgi:hydrogenase maturation protein HypF
MVDLNGKSSGKTEALSGARIHITGIVQGVGFRPFVYTLANRLGLNGWVCNTSAGVDIQVDGSSQALYEFSQSLRSEAPPLALIDELTYKACEAMGFVSFEIIPSHPIPEAFQPISPDIATCPDCLREMLDPDDRRYLYPFINCTNCGPRFTIIEDIPYDRPKTTMAGFPMCPQCAAEYHDPSNRRFHAQPTACQVCGPKVWLEIIPRGENGSTNLGYAQQAVAPLDPLNTAAIAAARHMLGQGKILAIKGLGGFHLACNALDQAAVDELRRRKLRVDKPFALMMPDLETIAEHCLLGNVEKELLSSPQRPVVILPRRTGSSVVQQVAPGQDTLGVMLPYTPLHHLLFAKGIPAFDETPHLTTLVMTSGNISEEPIATDNQEARDRLGTLADAFLMHDRPIRTRCDDSVMRTIYIPPAVAGIGDPGYNKSSHSQPSGEPVMHETACLLPLRRSRGYAPFPVHLPWLSRPILALGAELKNTFCITHAHYAFLSHHIGDLENYETLQSFEDGIQHFERLFRTQPQALAYDLHPNYLATRYALERADRENLPAIGVQHHHAHIAACMAEHGLPGDEPLIGLAFDGTGYGEDGAIWGGEILVASYTSYRRAAHLAYVPLPGGDKAVREPWRMTLAWLEHASIPWTDDLPPIQYIYGRKVQPGTPTPEQSLDALHHQLQSGLNSPPTSSMGRFFDAVSAMLGVRSIANYEAQAAIELEAQARRCAESQANAARQAYPDLSFELDDMIFDPSQLLSAILSDLRAGTPVSTIAMRFHNSMARLAWRICHDIREATGINRVAISGGVWQNMILLQATLRLLAEDHFMVYIHRQTPPNDGGLALGQAAVAAHKLRLADLSFTTL